MVHLTGLNSGSIFTLMQPSDSYLPSSEFSPRNASRPPFQLVRVNEHGIVLESERNFDIGTTMALGFHVNVDSRSEKSRFISVEAILVESKPRVTRSGQLVQEITLLFSEIDRKDRETLLQAPELLEASIPYWSRTAEELLSGLN